MKIGKILAAAVMSLLTIGFTEAQDLKFAHINSQQFLAELDEYKAANTAMQAEATKLEEQVKTMAAELQKKYQEYVEQRDSLPELIRATKEKELQDTQERIQNFQQLAQQSLQQKEQQLLQPIIEKYQKALQAVGAANGFTYIFDTTSQVILYQSEQSIDAAPLVKVEMSKQK